MLIQTQTAGIYLQENNMLKPRHIIALGGVSALLFAFAPAAMASSDVPVYGSVTGGALSITPATPVNVTSPVGPNGVATPWSTTLVTTGNPTSAQYTETVGTYDDRGTGAGWNETITSTEYTGINGAAATETNGTGPFEFGNSGDSSLASPSIPETSTIGTVNNAAIDDSYPASPGGVGFGNGLVIPQGGATGAPGVTGSVGTEPLGSTFNDAALGTGMGDFNVAVPVTVVVPADAYAGEYQSTLTLAINTGP